MAHDPVAELCAVLEGRSEGPASGKPREQFLDTARRHRVGPLVAWRSGLIDDEIRAAVLLDEIRVRELNRVLSALEAGGVAPLVLKGAAIAHTHYEQSWLRPRVDADILVPDIRVAQTFDVLASLAYVRTILISGDLVMYQAPFARTGAYGEGHCLDVHWRVANPQVVASLVTYDELLSRARVINVRGQPRRVPGDADALLLACVHRAVHHDDADDLLWLYDIHLVAERLPDDSWTAFVERACSGGVRALCARGLQLSADRFRTRVPPEVMARLCATGGVERSAMYLREGVRPVDRLMLDLAAVGPRSGLRLVWEHLFPPAAYIRQKYGVSSRALLPALYVRRALAGAWRWFSVGSRQ